MANKISREFMIHRFLNICMLRDGGETIGDQADFNNAGIEVNPIALLSKAYPFSFHIIGILV